MVEAEEAVRTGWRVLLFGLGLLACPRLPAEGHWGEATDRSQNALLADYLASSDLGEAVQLVRALGRRRDPYCSDVIGSLLSGRRRAPEREALLQELLAALNLARQPGDGRLEANLEGLQLLSEGLPGYDWSLRAQVIRLLGETGSPEFDRAVLAQAAALVRRLEEQAGRADAGQGALLLAVLDYAEARAKPLFLDPVLAILETTRDREAGRRAQRVAAALAALKRASVNPAEW